MSWDYHKRLESEIDRELKALPELLAPHTLILRVMAAIERRLNLPWYRQAWQRWPIALRIISLVVLLALFGGLCFAGWKLTHAASFVAALQQVGNWFSGIKALGHVLYVLISSVVLAARQLGMWFWIASFTVVAVAYAMCVGLGSVYVRLALAQR